MPGKKFSVFQKTLLGLLICVFFSVPAFAAVSGEEFLELCREGSPQQIAEAVKNGADVNTKGAYEYMDFDATMLFVEDTTPLMMAAYINPDPEVIAVLLDSGADINARDSNGNTPLAWAVEGGNVKMTESLIAAGADVNIKNNEGASPIGAVVFNYYSTEAMYALIKAGADINERNAEGETLIMRAVLVDNQFIIKPLVEAGVDINARNNYGMTPLMCAVSGVASNPEMITTLLELGADVNADNNGKTAMDYANESDKSDDIKIALGASITKEPVGFRSIPWETDISKLNDMRYMFDGENHPGIVKHYSRANDKMMIGPAALKSIEYQFVGGKFGGVWITTNGANNHASLVETLKTALGKPAEEGTQGGMAIIKYVSWTFPNVQVTHILDVAHDEALTMYTYVPLFRQIEQIKQELTRSGVDDL